MNREFTTVYINPHLLKSGNIVVVERSYGEGSNLAFKRVVKVNKKSYKYYECDQNGITTNPTLKTEKILFFSKIGCVPEAIFYPNEDKQPLWVKKLVRL